jgi:hypothetical protein
MTLHFGIVLGMVLATMTGWVLACRVARLPILAFRVAGWC